MNISIKNIVSSVAVALALVSTTAFANEAVFSALRSNFATDLLNLEPQMIRWQVGESQSFDISIGSFGKMGTLEKAVTSEDTAQNAIWIKQVADITIQKDVTEMLISRIDGKVLKYIHNGKEEELPSGGGMDDIEVIEQKYTEVTVPAGKFKCIYVALKSKDIEKMEAWINPKETVMEGLLKQTMLTQGMEIVVELTKFSKGK